MIPNSSESLLPSFTYPFSPPLHCSPFKREVICSKSDHKEDLQNQVAWSARIGADGNMDFQGAKSDLIYVHFLISSLGHLLK